MWKRIVSGIIAITATILLFAWWFGWLGEGRALAEVQALQDKLASPNLTDADFRATMDQVRGLMVNLSDSARRSAWESGRGVFEKRELSRIKRILTLTGQERTKALDDEINRSERRRSERQLRANQAQNGSKGGGQSGQRGPRSRGSQTDEQRISRLKSRLDHSTPEQRASRAEFTKLINERRAQRGMPPMQHGRG